MPLDPTSPELIALAELLTIAHDAETGTDRALIEQVDRAEDDPEDGSSFIASEPIEDRAGDVVASSWLVAAYKRNPVILADHDRRMVAGRAVEAKVHKVGDHADKLVVRVRWDLSAPDPTIRTIGHQHMNGFRSAVSVGFRAGKTTRRDKLSTDHPHYAAPRTVSTPWGDVEISGNLYERNELLEVSSVSIPMLPSALQMHYTDRLRECGYGDLVGRAEVVAETVPRLVGAALIEAIQADPTIARSLVGALWGDVLDTMRRDPQVYTAIRAAHEGRRVAPPTPAILRALATFEE